MAWQAQVILSVLAVGVLGCNSGLIEAATDELGEGDSGSESEDEIGDVETGTSGGAESTSTESTSTDGPTSDGSTSDESTSDESTSDESTSTEESTTTESTTTDTVVDTACNEPVSFTILAIDYASVYGWTETMSTLGENMVLSIPNGVNNALATYDIDIPCDDTWHIWVRGIEQGEYDSYWVRVEGQPQNWAIFELDCTVNPMENTYKWKQLNWRDPNAGGCQYVVDPWVQDWGVGVYELEIGYRESWAISKIWVSNTNDNPP